jgi:hypothetical protein
MDWDLLGRLTNVLLAVFCLGLLGRKMVKYWDRYQPRTKDFWWVLVVWCFVIVGGTLEVLLGWDTQFRVLFTTFALALTIKVLLQPNEIERPTFTKEF